MKVKYYICKILKGIVRRIKEKIPLFAKLVLEVQFKRRLKYQQRHNKNVKIAVLVPVYNTTKTYFKDMLKSVIHQTHQNWELCIADASDNNQSYIKSTIEKINDSRIHYKRIENKGISENTNVCIQMASSDYIAFLDHDDVLTRDALYEVANIIDIKNYDVDVIYSDEDKLEGKHRTLPFYKPDWSPDLLNAQMYICHLLVVKKKIVDLVGGFNTHLDGSQDYDLMLRLSEKTNKIVHIPRVLYSWRMVPQSTSINPSSKPYAQNAGLSALNEHLKRCYGDRAFANESEYLFVYDTRFILPEETKISIIIPTFDHVELLNNCVTSILEKSTYKNYEIIIINNASKEQITYDWFKSIAKHNNVKIINAKFEFNWSKLNNLGIRNASGDVFIFLNNDTQIITKDWMERLAENVLRKEVGVAGPLLLYEDNTIQHAGVVLGMSGWADHVFKGLQPNHFGSPYVSPMVNRNVLAVTGACMAVSRNTIEKIGYFNEDFIICGSDVELCIRAHNNGLWNMYDARVKLYHFESKSRTSHVPDSDFKMSSICYSPYRELGDPFYNSNLDYFNTSPTERR